MRRKPVPFASAITQDIRVPADAELVIEGWIEPDSARFHATAITHREQAIVPMLLPTEQSFFNNSFRLFLMPILRLLHQEIVDLSFPIQDDYYSLIVVSIAARLPGHAQKIMFGLWGLHQFDRNKTLVIVDAEVNVHDQEAIVTAILNHVDWQRDVTMVKGMIQNGEGQKIGINATKQTDTPAPHLQPTITPQSLKDVQWQQLSHNILLVTLVASPDEYWIDQLASETQCQLIILVTPGQAQTEPSVLIAQVLPQVDWETHLTVRHNTMIFNAIEATEA